MDMTHAYWEENSNIQRVKYEGCNSNEEAVQMKDDRGIYPCCDSNLNFSTATCSEDDCEYGPYKKSKVARGGFSSAKQDPMSHRIIEKRRRDRMNNCLADLSRLIPADYLKKGRGRIEKTEIIEMAIKHMKHLQQQDSGSPIEHYRLGYQECMSEAMRFMVEVEGHFPREAVCVRLLNHLQKQCEQISKPHAGFPSPSVPEQSPFPIQHHLTVAKNGHSVRNIQSKICDYAVPKAEPENSNSNDGHLNAFVHSHNTDSEFEKQVESNGMSYKYKTNIKLRFNQDIHAHEVPKRQMLENKRRNSINSFENQSSSHSSPPSSEPCTRTSDNENGSRQTPSDSASANNGQHKLEILRNDVIQRYSPNNKSQPHIDSNFNIPIFVLHAKGSYYIPLTIDYKTLLPFLQNYNILEIGSTTHNIVLHPVTINVNFLPNFNDDLKPTKYKCEYNNNWH